jgi:hypothetical protein
MNLSIASMRVSPRRSDAPMRNLAMLPMLMLLAAGCGLPTEPYLYPPISRTSIADPGVFIFENPGDNNPDVFLGFLIFYKLFDSSGTEQDGDLQAAGESFFTTYRLNAFDIPNERGVQSGYTLFKVIRISDIAAPGSWSEDSSRCTLNFADINTTSGTYISADSATVLLSFSPLYRKIFHSSTTSWEDPLIPFSSASGDYSLVPKDSDLPETITVLSGAGVTIAVWAVAYGFDIFDSFQNVYSEAEYIGQFDYTIF